MFGVTRFSNNVQVIYMCIVFKTVFVVNKSMQCIQYVEKYTKYLRYCPIGHTEFSNQIILGIYQFCRASKCYGFVEYSGM